MSRQTRIFLAILFGLQACTYSFSDHSHDHTECRDALYEEAQLPERLQMKGALLSTRFESFEELKSVLLLDYQSSGKGLAGLWRKKAGVRVRYCSQGQTLTSELTEGISQGDLLKIKNGTVWQQAALILKAPFTVRHRLDLERIYLLARIRPNLFGDGDVAFYTLAEAAYRKITTPQLAFLSPRDSSEKGYINTFNHITAQAFITTCFSEALADFVADAHERFHHPELIHGRFTHRQVSDLEEGPVDNYVDLINNEIGQELGKKLKAKYHITKRTRWTPDLMAAYLNDLQQYYGRAFHIGLMPFRADEEVVIRFAHKINQVMRQSNFDS
ncbi:MAG: hypothetical protein NZL95_07370 [Chitinophagales bacterium]|nr:hypothetical protein [Chitinophagales bacterium]MDW8428356.1 hypothetical protein [Chitinophagales bacterium]